jgi:hypothetical protein
MPLAITKTVGGTTYGPVFIGDIDHMQQVLVDISTLTTDEVDADGYLKPGVPFQKDGTLVSASSGQFVYAVNPEAQNLRMAVLPPTNATLAADTRTWPLGMGTMGEINRDIAEDNLGRAYTSNELAAFNAAGSMIHVTNT